MFVHDFYHFRGKWRPLEGKLEAKMVSNRLKISRRIIFLINGWSFDDEKPIEITLISGQEVFQNFDENLKIFGHF